VKTHSPAPWNGSRFRSLGEHGSRCNRYPPCVEEAKKLVASHSGLRASGDGAAVDDDGARRGQERPAAASHQDTHGAVRRLERFVDHGRDAGR